MTTWAEPKQLALLADPIDERFVEWHHANPDVYKRLVAMAHQWKNAGHDKCSMDMLVNNLRWSYGLETHGEPWRINDHYVSRYSRLIAANEPELAHLFNTRALRSDWERP